MNVRYRNRKFNNLQACLEKYLNVKHQLCIQLAIMAISLTSQIQGQHVIDSITFVLRSGTTVQQYEAALALARMHGNGSKDIVVDNIESLKYSEIARKIALELVDTARIITSSRISGQLFTRLNRYSEAQELFFAIQQVACKTGGSKDCELLELNLGITYIFTGHYEQALEVNFKLLHAFAMKGDNHGKAMVLNNMGVLYYKTLNFDVALNYYRQAYNLKKEIKDTYDLDRLLINMGLCYNLLGKHHEALKSFENGLALCTDNCREEILIEAELGIGIALISLKNFADAEKFLKSSLRRSIAVNEKRIQADALIALGRVCYFQNDFATALIYFEKAVAIAEQFRYADISLWAHGLISDTYKELHSYPLTVSYQKKYIQLRQDIYSEQASNKFRVLEAQFAQRDSEKRIEIQNQAIALNEGIIRQRKWINVLFVTIAVIVSCYTSFMVYSYIRKRRLANTLDRIVQDKTRVLADHVEEMESNFHLNFVILEKSRKEIRSCLSSILGFCEGGYSKNISPIPAEGAGHINSIIKSLDTSIDQLKSLARFDRDKIKN